MTGATRRFSARQEDKNGQGTSEIEQGSPQAEKGEGEDHRRQSVAEGRRARAGESEEQLGQVSYGSSGAGFTPAPVLRNLFP